MADAFEELLRDAFRIREYATNYAEALQLSIMLNPDVFSRKQFEQMTDEAFRLAERKKDYIPVPCWYN